MSESGVNVANAFVQIMPSMQGAEKSIADALVPAVEDAGSEGGEKGGEGILDGILGSLSGLGGKMAELGGEVGTSLWDGIKGITDAAGPAAIAGAAVAAGVAVGSALENVGATFDDMTDEIVVGTGASGDALQGLSDSAKNIATTVPISFQDAGDIVQWFNTRMGLTGDTLEEVGEKTAAVGELMGESVDMDKLTGAFNAFGLSGEQASSEMDYMFGVCQSTGMGFNELTSVIQSNAPAMTQMGFSFEETANMAGLLEKSGMDANSMMGKMSKGLTSLAQPGENARDAFSRVTQQIQGYIDKGDQASALDLASQIFGTKGAAQFVAAVQSGSMSLDALGSSALGASGDITVTEEATEDWPEQWQLIQNNISSALEPMGSAVFSTFGTVLGVVSDAMTGLWTASEPVRTTISDLATGAFAQLQPVLQPVADSLGQLGDSIMPVVSGAFSVIAGVLQVVGAALSAVFQWLSPVAAVFAGGLAAAISAVSGVLNVVGSVLSFVGSLFSTIASAAMSAWSPIGSFFSGIASGISTAFSAACSAIGSGFSAAASVVSGAASSMGSFLGGIWSGIKSAASGAIDGIKSVFSGGMDKVKSVVSGAIDRVRGFFNFHVSFPSIKLPHFSVSGSANPVDWLKQGVPKFSVEWYAKGGITDGPTLAVLGEGGNGHELNWPSYEPYLSRYGAAIAEHMPDTAGDSAAVIAWLEKYLGPIIAQYAPAATPREFRRMVSAAQ